MKKNTKGLRPDEIKVIKDYLDQKNESGRMMQNERFIWKLRGLFYRIEYWIIAFNFPIAIALGIFTQSLSIGLVFYLAGQMYNISANLRGLSLHVENILEYIFDKNL